VAPDVSTECRYTFLAALKAGLNVRVKFQVKLFPLGTTVALATFTEHWLFSNVVAAPSVAGISCLARFDALDQILNLDKNYSALPLDVYHAEFLKRLLFFY
jgi:hypothetical protein